MDNPWEFHKQAAITTEPVPQRLAIMWRSHNRINGKKCGDCAHLLIKEGHNHNYFKCELYGDSNGAGTDWRKKWMACGKFLEEVT